MLATCSPVLCVLSHEKYISSTLSQTIPELHLECSRVITDHKAEGKATLDLNELSVE